MDRRFDCSRCFIQVGNPPVLYRNGIPLAPYFTGPCDVRPAKADGNWTERSSINDRSAEAAADDGVDDDCRLHGHVL